MEFILSLLGLAKQYEFLLGLLGVSVLGIFAIFLKEIFNWIKKIFNKIFISSLEISSDHYETYTAVNDFLSKINATKFTNIFKLADRTSFETPWSITFGMGTHLFFFKKRPILINHSVEQNQGGYSKRYNMIFYKFGLNFNLFNDLIQEAIDSEINKKEFLKIYTWRGYWTKLEEKNKRLISSIFLPDTQINNVVNDIQWFISKECIAHYNKLGIPHRRGYLLYGPPGTGKSSFIQSIASKFNLPIFYLNLNTIPNDVALIDAFENIRKKSIVLIEDIDVAGLEKRNLPQLKLNKKELITSPSATDESGGITLSGLLNAIDGVIATDNRLLFMTTNDIGKIDSALLRPGRIDIIEKIDLLGPDEVRKMFKYYFDEELILNLPADFKISGCELQNELIKTIKMKKENAISLTINFLKLKEN